MVYNQKHEALAKQLQDAQDKIANETTNEDELAKVAEGALKALNNILFEADYEGYITNDVVAEIINSNAIPAVNNL